MEDLPIGWTKEIRNRKYAGGFVKDTFYTDPESGYVFRSKKDVFRYLKTGNILSCAIKPRKKDMTSATPPPRIGDYADDFHNGAGSLGPTTNSVEGELPENSSGSHGKTTNSVEEKLPENSSGKRKSIDLLPHPTSKKLSVFGSGSKPHVLPSSGSTERRNESNTGEIPIEYPAALEPFSQPRAASATLALPVPNIHAFSPPNNVSQNPPLNPFFRAGNPLLGPLFRATNPPLNPLCEATNPPLSPFFRAANPLLSPLFRAANPPLNPLFRANTGRSFPYSFGQYSSMLSRPQQQTLYQPPRPRANMPWPSVVVPDLPADPVVNNTTSVNHSLCHGPSLFWNQSSGQSSSALPLYQSHGSEIFRNYGSSQLSPFNMQAQNSNNASMNNHNNYMDSSTYEYYREIFPNGATNFMASDFDHVAMSSSESGSSSRTWSQ